MNYPTPLRLRKNRISWDPPLHPRIGTLRSGSLPLVRCSSPRRVGTREVPFEVTTRSRDMWTISFHSISAMADAVFLVRFGYMNLSNMVEGSQFSDPDEDDTSTVEEGQFGEANEDDTSSASAVFQGAPSRTSDLHAFDAAVPSGFTSDVSNGLSNGKHAVKPSSPLTVEDMSCKVESLALSFTSDESDGLVGGQRTPSPNSDYLAHTPISASGGLGTFDSLTLYDEDPFITFKLRPAQSPSPTMSESHAFYTVASSGFTSGVSNGLSNGQNTTQALVPFTCGDLSSTLDSHTPAFTSGAPGGLVGGQRAPSAVHTTTSDSGELGTFVACGQSLLAPIICSEHASGRFGPEPKPRTCNSEGLLRRCAQAPAPAAGLFGAAHKRTGFAPKTHSEHTSEPAPRFAFSTATSHNLHPQLQPPASFVALCSGWAAHHSATASSGTFRQQQQQQPPASHVALRSGSDEWIRWKELWHWHQSYRMDQATSRRHMRIYKACREEFLEASLEEVRAKVGFETPEAIDGAIKDELERALRLLAKGHFECNKHHFKAEPNHFGQNAIRFSGSKPVLQRRLMWFLFQVEVNFAKDEPRINQEINYQSKVQSRAS